MVGLWHEGDERRTYHCPVCPIYNGTDQPEETLKQRISLIGKRVKEQMENEGKILHS